MINQMSARTLKARLDAGESLVLLDVREPVELAIAALPDATHIPMREIPRRVDELNPDSAVVVVCHHGIRSTSVAHFLAERDFEAVYNLTGGIDAWSRTVDPGVPRY